MYRLENEDGMLRMIATKDFDGVKAGDEGGLVHPDTKLHGDCWIYPSATVGPRVILHSTIVHADLTAGWFENCVVKTPVKYNGYYVGVTLEDERSLELPLWNVVMFKDLIMIGCLHHSPEQWTNFTDSEITDMAYDLDWWREHKELILKQYELNYRS